MTSRVWGVLAILAVMVGAGILRTDGSRPSLQADETGQFRQSPEETLVMRGNWDCVDLPMKDWLELIHRRARIPVFVSETHLRDAGIEIETPVNLGIGEAPLLAALPLVLEPQGLDFAVVHGILIVDTKDDLELQLSTRVYPVQDLVNGGDWQSLMFAIQDSTSGLWEDFDGEGGTMNPVPTTGSLVISQTWKVHRQIHSLLAALRQAARLPDVGSIGATPLPDDNFDSLPLVPVTSRPRRPAVPAAAWQIPRLYDELQPKPVKRMPVGSGPGF